MCLNLRSQTEHTHNSPTDWTCVCDKCSIFYSISKFSLYVFFLVVIVVGSGGSDGDEHCCCHHYWAFQVILVRGFLLFVSFSFLHSFDMVMFVSSSTQITKNAARMDKAIINVFTGFNAII